MNRMSLPALCVLLLGPCPARAEEDPEEVRARRTTVDDNLARLKTYRGLMPHKVDAATASLGSKLEEAVFKRLDDGETDPWAPLPRRKPRKTTDPPLGPRAYIVLGP